MNYLIHKFNIQDFYLKSRGGGLALHIYIYIYIFIYFYINIYTSPLFQCLKSWDIKDHTCIQSVAIRLPFNSKSLDHGAFPFFLPPKCLGTLVISIGDCFTELKLGASAYLKRQSNTHSRPLCSALFNPSYKQVRSLAVIF